MNTLAKNDGGYTADFERARRERNEAERNQRSEEVKILVGRNRGKEKRVDDVEKVINTLPFLKTSTKTKKAAEAHVVDVEEMESQQDIDDNKKKKRYRIKEEAPPSPPKVKGRYKKSVGKKTMKQATKPATTSKRFTRGR
ncbi:hypothetical protein CTI12_AA433270 [Artemisia annua]|uniref:Uncharacterized protein n=1 Tax=Artemisia annua TaxID=35608 RepID=A0A2U1LZS4_ARTAN|nr:hypothetical protein CTI12_AA433270 [Artemisia annua]